VPEPAAQAARAAGIVLLSMAAAALAAGLAVALADRRWLAARACWSPA